VAGHCIRLPDAAEETGFTIVAALSLALGIGANTLIFSLINTTLLRPLPYADPDRLVEVWSVPKDHKDQRNWVTAYNLLAFRERAKSFEAMAARVSRCAISARISMDSRRKGSTAKT